MFLNNIDLDLRSFKNFVNLHVSTNYKNDMTTKNKRLKLNRKKIIENVKHKLNEDKTKNEIFKEIIADYKDVRTQKEIANIIRFVI